MAIKIVDDSKIIKPYAKYEATCESCHAVVQYLGCDVSFHKNYPQGYIYCPHCNRPIPHKEENKCDVDATPEEIKAAEKEENGKKAIVVIAVSLCLAIFITTITLIALFISGVL